MATTIISKQYLTVDATTNNHRTYFIAVNNKLWEGWYYVLGQVEKIIRSVNNKFRRLLNTK